MRVRSMELVRRFLDHSTTNEQYELEVVIRGSKDELQNIQKRLFE